jgi:hypothetical protein
MTFNCVCYYPTISSYKSLRSRSVDRYDLCHCFLQQNAIAKVFPKAELTGFKSSSFVPELYSISAIALALTVNFWRILAVIGSSKVGVLGIRYRSRLDVPDTLRIALGIAYRSPLGARCTPTYHPKS